MIIHKGFKFRLNATKNQTDVFKKDIGCCRFVYNKALEEKSYLFNEYETNVSFANLSKSLTIWKKLDQFSFLQTAPAVPLQQALRFLDKSFKGFFNKKSKYPKFKKRNRREVGLHFPQNIKIENNKVYIPTYGWFTFRKSQDIPQNGVLNDTTISVKNNKVYISFNFEIEINTIHPNLNSAIGIDLGINKIITFSDGSDSGKPMKEYYQKIINRRKRLQRALRLKKTESNNKRKKRLIIAKLYEREANIRRDVIHKMTSNITKNHGIVIMEALQVKNMSSSTRGTIEKPGKNVAQKRGLNREIQGVAFGEIARQLEYKTKWTGGTLIFVPPQNTSKICSNCGYKNEKLTLAIRNWTCPTCEILHDRDVNAAKNILAKGLGQGMPEFTLVECNLEAKVCEPKLKSCARRSKKPEGEAFSKENVLTRGISVF